MTDVENPIEISHLHIEEGDTDDIAFFEDDNFICTASGFVGVKVINITELSKPKIIGSSDNFQYSIEAVTVSHD